MNQVRWAGLMYTPFNNFQIFSLTQVTMLHKIKYRPRPWCSLIQVCCSLRHLHLSKNGTLQFSFFFKAEPHFEIKCVGHDKTVIFITSMNNNPRKAHNEEAELFYFELTTVYWDLQISLIRLCINIFSDKCTKNCQSGCQRKIVGFRAGNC